MTLQDAYAFCTRLAKSHYENFPVGRLVPATLQPHVHAIYAFARYADDLADEGYNPTSSQTSSDDWVRTSSSPASPKKALLPQQRLEALQDWEDQLRHPDRSNLHPIFTALHHTIEELDLPQQLFTDLLSAFQQDVVQTRYTTFEEVLDYCRRSANPIGRLVLLLHGQRDPHQHHLSDFICTALQLANFWQDIAVDLDKDRLYLPQKELQHFGVSEEDLFQHHPTASFRQLLRFQVDRTQKIFEQGKFLLHTLPGKLRWEIHLTWLGGTRILHKIEDQNYDTLTQRPRLTKSEFLPLLIQAFLHP